MTPFWSLGIVEKFAPRAEVGPSTGVYSSSTTHRSVYELSRADPRARLLLAVEPRVCRRQGVQLAVGQFSQTRVEGTPMLVNSVIVRPLTKDETDKVLSWPGVYALYQGNELILYGAAERVCLRDAVERHRMGQVRCTRGATHFSVEHSQGASGLWNRRLAEYRRLHGQYPRCNRGGWFGVVVAS